MARVMAVIAAAGQGKRMKSSLNKQFMLLQGMPIIWHTLRAFQAADIIEKMVVVCGPGEEEYYRQELLVNDDFAKPVSLVTGGRERQDSVYQGLLSITGRCDYVLIHDGARPLVTVELISRLAEEASLTGAVVLGVPVKDTIKRTDARGYITETPPRDGLWQIQTPQAFRFDLIKRAHDEARATGFYGSDDATLVERLGLAVKVIPGSYENIKITTPGDITIAETILQGRGKA